MNFVVIAQVMNKRLGLRHHVSQGVEGIDRLLQECSYLPLSAHGNWLCNGASHGSDTCSLIIPNTRIEY